MTTDTRLPKAREIGDQVDADEFSGHRTISDLVTEAIASRDAIYQAAIRDAVGLLEAAEWHSGDCGGECPWCGEMRDEDRERGGHAYNCAGFEVLARLRPLLGEGG